MKKLVKYTTSIIVLATSLGWSSTIAANAEERDTPVTEIAKISSLTPEQKEAINAYVAQGREASAKKEYSSKTSPQETKASGSERAYLYRGSFLMWTRDNVEFSYSNSEVTRSSGYQESGAVFPNFAENKGINRYDKISSRHSWRAKNTVGARVDGPIGNITIYKSDFTHRIDVYGSGGWYTWDIS